MVIDHLTPSQGHQFDRRLKLFSVSCSSPLIWYSTWPCPEIFFDPSPRPQGAGTQTIVPVHVPFVWVTHTLNLVGFHKKIDTPTPTVPLSPTPGYDPGGRMKIPSDMLYIFHLWVWFKNLWNWLCNSDLMIFDLLAPPQGTRGGGGGIKMAPVHVPFM